MAMNVSLVMSGNADEAVRAVNQATGAMKDLGDKNDAAAKSTRTAATAARELAPAEQAAARAARDLADSVDDVGSSSTGAAHGLTALKVGVGAFFGALAAGLVQQAAQAPAAIGRAVLGAADAMDTLADRSAALGVSTSFLQAMEFAAVQLGAEMDQVSPALEKLQQQLGDIARGGGKEAKKALDLLGVSATDSRGRIKSLEVIVPQLADAFRGVSSEAERLSLGQDLFGRGNATFVNALDDGSRALSEQMQRAREMGAVLDEELVRKGADAKDQIDAMSQAISTQLNGALVDVLPLVVTLTADIAALTKQVLSFLDGFHAVENRATSTLKSEAADLRKQIDILQGGNLNDALGYSWGPEFLGQFTNRAMGGDGGVTALKKQLADIEAQIADRVRVPVSAREPDEAVRSIAAEVSATTALTKARKDATAATGRGGLSDAEREALQMKAEGARLTAAMLTPTERYAAEMERLNELYKAGEISVDTYWRAVAQLNEETPQAEEQTRLAASRLELMTAIADSGRSIFTSFASDIRNGSSLLDALANAAISAGDAVAKMFLDMASNSLFGGSGGGFLGSFLGSLFTGGGPSLYANGAAFAGGNVTAFASGGVVNGPTVFPMAGGRTGLMGEAGAEAIMPLRRLANGRLGVESGGGGAVALTYAPSIVVNGPGDYGTIKELLDQQRRDFERRLPDQIRDARRRGQV